MIKFINVEELLSIRNDILREGKLLPEDCAFDTDKINGAFHLGYYSGDELACIGSFHPQDCGDFSGKGYQLRGMATIARQQGKGHGNQLLNFAIVYLRGKKISYLWCNARKSALPFYLKMGFKIISEEFEVHGIGPHYVMYIKIS
ncbi:GNAT family N-acetyltransferase [Mucilaginibacter hurinus]|uniref:GNAT family N-acetyltransferase n=1 Tax=Mucilaginibacter hurinus TaxID=2201324 RepID=A0A367GMS1_9SPHI|nr:GNAT family N-acetyltransferase [Mucilaginibacter hurinus]RCH54328.1 GNAT family N-acetyltransferase [Mucilaginibacter hurinus]